MTKPARLYPKPEPITINPRFLLIGCTITSTIFFVVGIIFSNFFTGLI